MSSSLLRYNDFQLVRTSKIRGIGENTGEKMEIYLVPGNTTGSERTFLERHAENSEKTEGGYLPVFLLKRRSLSCTTR